MSKATDGIIEPLIDRELKAIEKVTGTKYKTRKTTLGEIMLADVLEKKPKTFKPMLSATCEDITTLKFPVLVSPKLDGIRCIIRGRVAVSRNLKPIPNKYIQEKLKGLPDGLDGELIVGKPTGDDVWNRSQSGVMSEDGEPDFRFYIFDKCADYLPDFFEMRLNDARVDVAEAHLKGNFHPWLVPHIPVANFEDLASIENGYVIQGYEGVMIRDPQGKYKYGRSTVKEGGLLKLKRWFDAEAIVVDMVERQHNGNEATKDELGRTKRSSSKANKTGRGDMGTLVCTWPAKPGEPVAVVIDTFEIGTGFTDQQRKGMWEATKGANLSVLEKPGCIGQIVKFKYQSLSPEGIPRFPVFLGFRDERDMST